MATVSVIVPNYNHARYLRRRIESILAQTYQDYELILLDDCSSDDSREILKSYAGDARVRVEFNEQNSGTPFKQWNKGVRMANGKYIWMAESDDYADPRLLERLVGRLEEHADVSYAYCRSWDIREDGQPRGFADIYLNPFDANHWRNDFLVDGFEECRRFFATSNPVPNASAVVFRKEVYERVGGTDERLKLCGDYKVMAAMAMEGRIAYVGEPLNYYRTHTQNARTRSGAGALGLAEYFQTMSWVVNRVSEHDGIADKIDTEGLLERPLEMTPAQRIRGCLKVMERIIDWNLRHNRTVPGKSVRDHFEEWGFALKEKEFLYSAPNRWALLRHKSRFYIFYFPAMDWKWRLAQPWRIAGAFVLGYQGERARQAARTGLLSPGTQEEAEIIAPLEHAK